MTVGFMELLTSYIPNVRKLICHYNKVESYNWLTNKLLSTWKLEEFVMGNISSAAITRMAPYLQDVTVMDQSASVMDDFPVIAIAHHCPELKTLKLWKGTYTVSSIIALSEQGLPLEWLNLPYIPTIPDADTAMRCAHALSRLRNVFTSEITKHNNIDTAILCIPYLTGIQYLTLNSSDDPDLLPLLAQHCHSIECIHLDSYDLSLPDVLALCQANASLEYIQSRVHLPPLTDDMLLALVQSCPRLENIAFTCAITGIGLLALSEHCPQLLEFNITECAQVTETTLLQLLQRCRKLKQLYVPKLSLSAEAAAEVQRTRRIVIMRY